MTSAHAYDLPSGGRLVVPARDDDEIAAGHVVPLSRDGRPVAALTPIDPDQAWFWTPEWQAKEAKADADLSAGRFIRHTNDTDFLASLDED